MKQNRQEIAASWKQLVPYKFGASQEVTGSIELRLNRAYFCDYESITNQEMSLSSQPFILCVCVCVLSAFLQGF